MYCSNRRIRRNNLRISQSEKQIFFPRNSTGTLADTKTTILRIFYNNLADFLAFIRQFWKVLNIFSLALYLSFMALNYKDIYDKKSRVCGKKLDSFPIVKFRLYLFGNCQLGKCHFLFWAFVWLDQMFSPGILLKKIYFIPQLI